MTKINFILEDEEIEVSSRHNSLKIDCRLFDLKHGASMGLTWVCVRSSEFWLLDWYFVRHNGNWYSSDIFACSWDSFFSYWIALSSINMRTFTLSYCIYFSLFGCCLLKVCSSLNRIWREVHLGKGEEGRAGQNGERDWLQCIAGEKNLFSLK